MKILGKEISKKVLIGLIAGILVVGGVTITVIVSNSKSVKGNLSSMEKLRFILPNEFRLYYNKDNETQYDYEASDEWCRINVSIDDGYINDDQAIEKWSYSSIQHLLNLGVYKENDLENFKLDVKTINKREWTTFSVSNDNYYIFKDVTGSLYIMEFSGNPDALSKSTSYCSKAYNTVINSLDFK